MSAEHVSQRVIDDLIEFLQLNCVNNRYTTSIQALTDRLKYSPTTLHRALRKLQTDEVITIEKALRPNEPSTIIYHGHSIEDTLLTEGSRLCQEAGQNHDKLVAHVDACHKIIRRLKRELDDHNEFKSRIVSITPINNELESVIVRK